MDNSNSSRQSVDRNAVNRARKIRGQRPSSNKTASPKIPVFDIISATNGNSLRITHEEKKGFTKEIELPLDAIQLSDLRQANLLASWLNSAIRPGYNTDTNCEKWLTIEDGIVKISYLSKAQLLYKEAQWLAANPDFTLEDLSARRRVTTYCQRTIDQFNLEFNQAKRNGVGEQDLPNRPFFTNEQLLAVAEKENYTPPSGLFLENSQTTSQEDSERKDTSQKDEPVSPKPKGPSPG